MSNREAQLLAILERDAVIWKQRTSARFAMVDATEDKIARARKRGEAKRLAREKMKRIAAGLSLRKPYYPLGSWSSGERPDGFRAGDAACIACGKGYNPAARRGSPVCSKACGRAVYDFKNPHRRRSVRLNGSQPQAEARSADPAAIPLCPGNYRLSTGF